MPLILGALGEKEWRQTRRKSFVDFDLLFRRKRYRGQKTNKSTDEVESHVLSSDRVTCRTHT